LTEKDAGMSHQSTRQVAGNASGSLPGPSLITLKVNGIVKQIEVRPWVTLLDLLREQLNLTGTKKGCDHGQCGDQQFGRIMNHNLAEYHVPVNADVHDIDVIFVEEDVIFVEENDAIVNPLGVKGLGEIGVVGVAAAIANAVFHATGRRVRELPFTLDKLL
jgi:hypothetical protein